MKDINELLTDKKKNLDNIKVPVELENRLLKALKDKEKPRSKESSLSRKVIAACLIILLIGFNFNTLAYYSKKLIGYDQIMGTTIRNLNELGRGQIIEESHVFSNGVIFTLDGIMIDENQLLAFYTVADPSGEKDLISLNPSMELKGLYKRYFVGGGAGEMQEDTNEVKWVMNFQPPAFYERSLRLNVSFPIDGVMEQGTISFKLDRSKAMQSTLKQSIDKAFESNGVTVKFNTIIASPTTTVVEGTIQNILELAMDQLSGERLRHNTLGLKLIANGQELEKQQGSITTDLKGITFSSGFDALPSNLETLQLVLESFSVDKDVNEVISLNKDISGVSVEIGRQMLEINEVYELDGSAYINFTTEEDVILTKVYLLVDDEKIEIKETLDFDLNKDADGRVTYTRTMKFPKIGESYKLVIERISFTEMFNEIIDIVIK